jgi:rhodanese-related sulfurtransferase
MSAPQAVAPQSLSQSLKQFPPPAVIDVRRAESFARDPRLIAGAIRRAPEQLDAWASQAEPWRPVVLYCVHGHDVGRDAAATLEARGLRASYLAGGLEAWRESGGAMAPFAEPTRWVTRERPKIDRIACPWLVRRFIDPDARFFYVPAADVVAFAREHGAEPFDVPGVRYTHDGARCSFDAFIAHHELADAALAKLAAIVRAADTNTLETANEAPGLLAVSMGLARLFDDDHEMLRYGMLVYDALYARCLAAGRTCR